jgi:hypothetical protein
MLDTPTPLIRTSPGTANGEREISCGAITNLGETDAITVRRTMDPH